jgi:hypothetical protein
MIETVVGSSVIAALVTAIVTVTTKLIDRERESVVRSEERLEARKDRAAEIDLEDRRERARRETERVEKRSTEGRAQALRLLQALDELDAHFDAEATPGFYGTFSYKRELYRPVSSASRLVPDAEFREYVGLATRVITELWVPAKMGEGPEHPSDEQRRILRNLIEQVGRYITDDGWDRSLVAELRSIQDSIDEYWEEYHRPS